MADPFQQISVPHVRAPNDDVAGEGADDGGVLATGEQPDAEQDAPGVGFEHGGQEVGATDVDGVAVGVGTVVEGGSGEDKMEALTKKASMMKRQESKVPYLTVIFLRCFMRR